MPIMMGSLMHGLWSTTMQIPLSLGSLYRMRLALSHFLQEPYPRLVLCPCTRGSLLMVIRYLRFNLTKAEKFSYLTKTPFLQKFNCPGCVTTLILSSITHKMV